MAGDLAREELDALIEGKWGEIGRFLDERLIPLMVRYALQEGDGPWIAEGIELLPGEGVRPQATRVIRGELGLVEEGPPSGLPATAEIAEWLRLHHDWRTGRIVMGFLERAPAGLPRPALDAGLRAWGYSCRSVGRALARLAEAGALAFDPATGSWRMTEEYMSGIQGEAIAIGFREKAASSLLPADGEACHG